MKNFISRPFVCDKSHALAKHKAVWGTSSQCFHIENIYGRIKDHITPHIISWKQQPGKILVTATCGIIGCGCRYDADKKRLIITNIKNFEFPIREWNALVGFKNTGFEL